MQDYKKEQDQFFAELECMKEIGNDRKVEYFLRPENSEKLDRAIENIEKWPQTGKSRSERRKLLVEWLYEEFGP